MRLRNRYGWPAALADLGVVVLLAGIFALLGIAYIDAGMLRGVIAGLVRR
jgi:hypothetical protein